MRSQNEDSLLVRPDLRDNSIRETEESLEVDTEQALFAVADGMGGSVAGEVASDLAIGSFGEIIHSKGIRPDATEEEVRELIDRLVAFSQVTMFERSEWTPEVEGMGSTLVMGMIRNGGLHVAWVGDSRCYLHRQGDLLRCLTKDHSHVQELVDNGSIDPEDAFGHPHSNVITRAIICEYGTDPTPDHFDCDLKAGDRLLFCSDGLNDMLRDREIEEILETEEDPDSCVQRLVAEANGKGGRDNITVILVDVVAL